ncbi:YqaJ viral recombinase family protein [Cohnella soli]|uniref:YqaJ viral recombinase family protein n=1 Tax=Cohnella soli TaxID=425005 RepID=A0ABW0I3Y3_9BACL
MAKVLTQTRTLTGEEWLIWRRKGLGGSDAAAILGKDRRKSAMQVYLDKIGEYSEQPATEAMLLGNRLKSFIARQFSELTGLKTFRRNMIFCHPEHDYLIATIDRWVVGDGAGLLCKSAAEYLKQQWEQGSIPEEVDIQSQHYMAVTGVDHWWVAGLVGGNKMNIVRVERDEELISRLMTAAGKFWSEHVLKQIPPTADGSAASAELLGRMYPPERVSRAAIALPDEAEGWIDQFVEASKEERTAQYKKTEAENRLKALLGQHESGMIGAHRVDWKTVNRKADGHTSYRRFTVLPAKQENKGGAAFD